MASTGKSGRAPSPEVGAQRPPLPKQHGPRRPSLSQLIMMAVANAKPPVLLATIKETVEAGGCTVATGGNKRRFKKTLSRLVVRQVLRKAKGTQALGKGKGRGCKAVEQESRKGEKATNKTHVMVGFGKKKANVWSSPAKDAGRGEASISPAGSRAQ